MYRIQAQTEFDASHFLQETATKCDQLHGHRWIVRAVFSSKTLTKEGWVVNFTQVKDWLKEVVGQYDHTLLNFYLDQPTAENLCACIHFHLVSRVREYNREKKMNVWVDQVEIFETPTNSAIYTHSGMDDAVRDRKSRIAKKQWASQEGREKKLKGLREANKNEQLRKSRSIRLTEHNPMHDRHTVEKMITALRKTQHLSPNKEEKSVIAFFEQESIPLRFVGDGAVIIDGKIPDFINEEKRVVVEYNNRFWHCNDNEWYDVKDDSADRVLFFIDRGYKVYIIWDDVFKSDPQRVKRGIMELLK